MTVTSKNKYVKGTHLSERKFKQLLRLFCADLPALRIADLCNLNRNTVNRYLSLFRERIAEECEAGSPFSKGEFRFTVRGGDR